MLNSLYWQKCGRASLSQWDLIGVLFAQQRWQITFKYTLVQYRTWFLMLCLSWTFTLSLYFPFDYMTTHVLFTWLWSFHHPLHSSYHSDLLLYLCLSHSNLISLLSQIICLIALCFYLSPYCHSLLSIWLSLYLLHFVLLFYTLSSYWTLHSTSWHDLLLPFLQSSEYFLCSYWLIVQFSNHGCL